MKKFLTVAALVTLVGVLGQVQADENTTAQVGLAAPDFTLTDLNGTEHTLSSHKGMVVVLEWFNPDCPYVVKHHRHNKTMKETFAAYKDKDVVWLAINSGAPGKQGHGLERNQRAIEEYEMEYPVLVDESGEVGRLYGARTTPHMYVIDTDGVLRYAGAIDNDKNPRKLGDTNYVRVALDAVLAGEEVETAETRAYGCGVKYGRKASR